MREYRALADIIHNTSAEGKQLVIGLLNVQKAIIKERKEKLVKTGRVTPSGAYA